MSKKDDKFKDIIPDDEFQEPQPYDDNVIDDLVISDDDNKSKEAQLPKEDKFKDIISEDFNSDYQAKKERFFSVTQGIINLDAKDAFEILEGKQSFWNSTKAAGALLIQNPIGFVSTGGAILYNNMRHGDNYIKDAKELIQTLNTGQEPDAINKPFFLNIIDDIDTTTFLEKNGAAVTNFIKLTSITLVAREFGKIDNSKQEQQNNIINQDRENIKILKEVLKTISKDEVETIAEQKKIISELENKIRLSSKNNRAALLQDLAKVGIDAKYVNDKITPVLVSGAEYLIKDPDKLITIAKLATTRAFTNDPALKKDQLKQLINNLDVPQMLASTELSSFLDTESPFLAKTGFNFLKLNDKFKYTLENLEKDNFNDEYFSKNFPLIATSGIKYLLNNPKLPDIITLALERNSIADAAKKTENLVALIDNVNVPKMLTAVNLSAVLEKENNNLAEIGTIILKSNDKFEEISSKLQINENLVKDTLSVGIKIAATWAGNESALTEIYEKLKPVILDNSKAEKQTNKNNPAKIAEIEKNSLIKKLELAGSVVKLANSDPSSKVINEIPTLLKNNSANIGIIIANVQEKYPNSALSRIIQKAVPEGKIDAEEGAKLVNFFAEVSQKTLPIISNLASASLNHPSDLADIIEQTKKVIDSKENSRKAEQNLADLKISFSELKNTSLQQKLADPEKLLNIVTQTEQMISYYEIQSKKNNNKDLQDLTSALAELKAKSVEEKLANPDKLLDIIKQTEQIVDTHQITKKDEIKNLISMLAKFKKEHKEIAQVIDKDLPNLLQTHNEELGKALEVFLSQTKIGKKINLEGKNILSVAAKKTPLIIEVAELYAQNKYAAIIPKAVQILADKEVLKLAIKATVNFITYKNTPQEQAEKIGNAVDKQYLNKNSNISQSPPSASTKQKKSTLNISM